ncbi:type I-F CRISPR-associated protein Csy2 [Paraburkholderia bonniea]|uniref:type I-F CRISPR-associated protein Csy2 n=1 Tax=Paraburkholderia bonniea TaxID=2152891 RepID=UPI0012908CB9|nr:type I-F CRISPR-associated protein Csy2 [Paraburkholderia bonniea]
MTNLTKALLVLPHLRVQNANAISSPLTYGFPSMTAFTGLMWALQRQLAAAGIPLQLQQVGVICHHYEAQMNDGYVKTFRLTRNPIDKDGSTAAIVEEGRIHLDLTLLFQVAQPAEQAWSNDSQLAEWAAQVGEIVSRMRVAGGTLLPPGPPRPGRRTRPWLAKLSEVDEVQTQDFARWRRQWLPGYALVGRDDLLAERYQTLRDEKPDATLLDAWLHAARFNHQPVMDAAAGIAADAATAIANDDANDDANDAMTVEAIKPATTAKKLRWADPVRQKGAGWTVPIPVGYAALQAPLAAGAVANTRDDSTPSVFVESVYSFGQWISPHRLNRLDELMWQPSTRSDASTDAATGLYRCYSGYSPHDADDTELPDFT